MQLTEAQEKALGLGPTSVKIGAGKSACVYAVGEKEIVKLTHDASDALACWLVAQRAPQPRWIVPVRGVFRLKGAYAIQAARVEKLPQAWVDPIEELFGYTDDCDDEWQDVYRDCIREIEWLEAEHRGATENDRRMRQVLEALDEGIKALRELGFIWEDWHSDNWGLLDGRPVIIDLGKLDLLDSKSENTIEKRAREIPVLPF